MGDIPEAMSQLTVAECFSEYLGVQIKVILYDTMRMSAHAKGHRGRVDRRWGAERRHSLDGLIASYT